MHGTATHINQLRIPARLLQARRLPSNWIFVQQPFFCHLRNSTICKSPALFLLAFHFWYYFSDMLTRSTFPLS